LPSYAFNRPGSPPGDHRSRLEGPCNIPIILLTLCECAPERLPCLVEYLKATQLFPRPYPRFTSYLYQVYETIPPLVTSRYTIWAKVIVSVATYRRVVTRGVSLTPHPPPQEGGQPTPGPVGPLFPQGPHLPPDIPGVPSSFRSRFGWGPSGISHVSPTVRHICLLSPSGSPQLTYYLQRR